MIKLIVAVGRVGHFQELGGTFRRTSAAPGRAAGIPDTDAVGHLLSLSFSGRLLQQTEGLISRRLLWSRVTLMITVTGGDLPLPRTPQSHGNSLED